MVTCARPCVLSRIITKLAFTKEVALIIYTLSELAEKNQKAFPFVIFKKTKDIGRNLLKWVKDLHNEIDFRKRKKLIKKIEDTNKWKDVCTLEELILLKYP